jgi:hypothetical protein
MDRYNVTDKTTNRELHCYGETGRKVSQTYRKKEKMV